MFAVFAIIAGSLSAPVEAQLADPAPELLQQIEVEDRLGAQVPTDLSFLDSDGEWIELGRLMDGERPVLLTLNYYRCPMLCGLQLKGLVAGLRSLEWTVGDEFRVVTVSINPLETAALAAATKQSYLDRYGRPGAGDGWHFLTGREEAVRALADAVGFDYERDPHTGEYAHPAVAYILTPEGRVARILSGIEYPGPTLRMALVEASEGAIGTVWDRLLMFCYHYDPSRRGYALVAMRAMQIGAGLSAGVLGAALGLLWWRERRRTPRRETRTTRG